MPRRDPYGCSSRDDSCLVLSFDARARDAASALARNSAAIEQTRTGTPGQKTSPWRRGRTPGDYSR
jgi:hypothetical protein